MPLKGINSSGPTVPAQYAGRAGAAHSIMALSASIAANLLPICFIVCISPYANSPPGYGGEKCTPRITGNGSPGLSLFISVNMWKFSHSVCLNFFSPPPRDSTFQTTEYIGVSLRSNETLSHANPVLCEGRIRSAIGPCLPRQIS